MQGTRASCGQCTPACPLGLVELDLLVDLVTVLAVVGDSGFHQSRWHLEILRGLRNGSFIVAHRRNDLPHVQATPYETCAPPTWPIEEMDQWMHVVTETLFHVTLRESPLRKTCTTRSLDEALPLARCESQRVMIGHKNKL